VKQLPAAVALVLMCALLAGCGIAFGGSDQGNDFFTSLRVSGNKTVGAPLTAAVAYETFYPSPVDIVCELRRGRETLRPIGTFQAPAVQGLTPDDDGVPGNYSLDFSVEAPGHYKIECYTVKEEANYIVEEFTVGAGR
jgi:hypothetical protein